MSAPSKYGRSWSKGACAGSVVSLGLWLPVYFKVQDTWPDAKWVDLAGLALLAAAFLSLAWLTCAFSEYFEKQERNDRK